MPLDAEVRRELLLSRVPVAALDELHDADGPPPRPPASHDAEGRRRLPLPVPRVEHDDRGSGHACDGTVAGPMDVMLQTRADGSPILVWRFARACLTCSTGPHGGGLGLRSWAFNAQVPTGYSHPDPDAHCAEMAVDLGLAGEGVGL